jgi:hypothetical protein
MLKQAWQYYSFGRGTKTNSDQYGIKMKLPDPNRKAGDGEM